MAKVRRGSHKSHMEWTVRRLIEEVSNGTVDFNIDIQRGYVWKDNDQKSLLIQSLILDDFVPPLYFNQIDDTYEGMDGKQKTYTIIKFVNDEFSLSGLQDISIINDDGEEEEIDINGLKYSELPMFLKNAIMEFAFEICFKINADQADVGRNFYNLNNGTKIGAASINRIKAKSKDQIIRLGKHKLFQEALSESAIEAHVNDDLVGRAHAVLKDENVCMDASWIRRYMMNAEITEADERLLGKTFDRIAGIHELIEDTKIAKKIYTRTHMISIIPIIVKSIEDGKSDKEMMKWFVEFFPGKGRTTVSDSYNKAAGGSGTGKNSAVRIRLDEIRKNYIDFFSKKDASIK